MPRKIRPDRAAMIDAKREMMIARKCTGACFACDAVMLGECMALAQEIKRQRG